jgi:hypothetical protein
LSLGIAGGWTIEQVFRTLKSAGVQVDDSQLTQARHFVKLTVVALIAAARIMQIVIGRDGGRLVRLYITWLQASWPKNYCPRHHPS